MVSTGSKSAPVRPHAGGPEVDKLSREHAAHHFDGFAGRLIREMPEKDRKAIKYYVIDSYEKGSQNWSDDLEISFRQQYGYDPIPYLPVFTGRVVGSTEQSERFMWDLRRLVADRVSFEYVGGLREVANKHGWQLWLENYGHWGFPGEFLQYGGQADLAYFIGEDAPKMTGIRDPEVPPGYSYDYINGDVILERMQVQNGRLILPDGMSYRMLVLPPLDNMRPELLQKIRDLVKAGGNIYGPPPSHSPSLENYPEADDQVKALAHEIWQDCDGLHTTSSQLGKGAVYYGVSLEIVLEALDTPPDLELEGHPEILWIHRKTEDYLMKSR